MDPLGALTAKALKGAWRPVPPSPEVSPAELEAVTKHLHATGTSGLAWWAIQKDPVLAAGDPAAELQASFRTIALSRGLHEVRLGAAIDAVTATGVQPLLLKGWSMARAYPSPGLRPCGDVDLAVPAADHHRVERALDARPSDRDWIGVDLEHRFLTTDGTPLRELLTRSQHAPLGDREVRVPGDADQLRLVCIHYLRAGGGQLRALCDVALLLESAPEDMDWDVVLGNRRHRDWVTVAAGLAARLLDADLSGTPLADAAHRVPAWVERHVVAGLGTAASADPGHLPPFRVSSSPTDLARQLKARWPDDGLEVALHHRRLIPRRTPSGVKAFDLLYRGVALAAPVRMRRARRDGSPELAG